MKSCFPKLLRKNKRILVRSSQSVGFEGLKIFQQGKSETEDICMIGQNLISRKNFYEFTFFSSDPQGCKELVEMAFTIKKHFITKA